MSRLIWVPDQGRASALPFMTNGPVPLVFAAEFCGDFLTRGVRVPTGIPTDPIHRLSGFCDRLSSDRQCLTR